MNISNEEFTSVSDIYKSLYRVKNDLRSFNDMYIRYHHYRLLDQQNFDDTVLCDNDPFIDINIEHFIDYDEESTNCGLGYDESDENESDNSNDDPFVDKRYIYT